MKYSNNNYNNSKERPKRQALAVVQGRGCSAGVGVTAEGRIFKILHRKTKIQPTFAINLFLTIFSAIVIEIDSV
ncbi:hypothetical protein QR98_0004770 [Sarcoptes scabiei]|uniref:Uncharacterized protein n=1 Tax=Sarcoptes scabiei TaxID=52283 RepID=A0A131ZU05_SARSC|nr:hypothetical protein QR98_0004770 [Sarcoptes scabiei]